MQTISENTHSQESSPKERLWMRLLKNKYLLTGIAFLAWMFFIDRNDIPTQWKRIQELNTLKQSERAMDKQISDTKQELGLLKTSPATLEKYAREKYMMKKDNEDLYIISATKQ